jgi:hypothetical protein
MNIIQQMKYQLHVHCVNLVHIEGGIIVHIISLHVHENHKS